MYERDEENIGDRAVKAAAFVAGGRVLVRLLSLVNLAILGRLLSPDDYGVAALAFVSIGTLQALTDVKVLTALITAERIEQSDIDTAFTLQLIRAVLIAGAVFFGADLIAALVRAPNLADPLRVLSVVLLFDGLKNPAFILYTRNMDFSKEFYREVVSNLLGIAVSIAAAFYFRSYWAIVTATFVQRFLLMLFTYVRVEGRPGLGLTGWRKFLGFGVWLTLEGIMSSLQSFFVQGAISRMISPAAVGQFTIGRQVSSVAVQEPLLPISNVLLAGFSMITADTAKLGQKVRLAQQVALGIALPLGMGLSLLAEPIVMLAVGDQWDRAVLLLRWVGPAMAIHAAGEACNALALARQDSRAVFFRAFFSLLAMIVLVLAGIALGGFRGAVIAYAAHLVFTLFLYLDIARRAVGLPLYQFLVDSWRSFAAAGVMVALVFAGRHLVPIAIEGASLALHLAVWVTAGAAAYVSALLLLWNAAGRPAGFEHQMLYHGRAALRRLRPNGSRG